MKKTPTITMNVQHVTRSMGKRRQRIYPKLTREQQELVKEHKWIAGRLAHGAECLTGGYTGSLTKEDLESVANFALCVAATRYNPDKGIQFSTFAWKTARGYIQHALRDYSRLVKTPRWVPSIKKKVDEALKENKSYKEIAEELGVVESKVLMAEMSSNNYHVSYDSSPEDWVSREFIYNEDDVKPYLVSDQLVSAMKQLTESQLAVLVRYTEDDKSLPPTDREWAVEKFNELHSIAHGFCDEA